MRAFGEVLSEAMREKGVTAKELSDLSGVSQPHISQIVRGKVVDPSFLRAAALIKALGLTLDEFSKLQDAD
jgi:transcriptional regulator with XRE-family HTH domain